MGIAMSPEKLSEFFNILSRGANINLSKLTTLYKPTDTSAEAQRFENFISNYDLNFIGGANAQNFKIKNNVTLVESVIKVEYRMGMPKIIEQNLRESVLKDKLAPVFSERQASFDHALHGPTTCCLVHTALVKGGDLEAYAKKYPDEQKRFTVAIDLYKQMCDVFILMEKNNYAFPDAKNTNWLVNDQNRLQLTDTKSFIPINPDGKFTIAVNKETKGYSFISTPYLTPPEIRRNDNPGETDAKAMHAYMLGKNLYQFVTNSDFNAIAEETKEFDFSPTVFRTPEGVLLKDLIQKIIQDDPKGRISVQEIKHRLELIEYRREIRATLNRLKLIDQSFDSTLLENQLNQATRSNVQEVRKQLKSQYIQFLLNQCGQLKLEISTTLASIDNQNPSALQTELETIQKTIEKNKDNPKVLIKLRECLIMQKDYFTSLNDRLSKHSLQKEPTTNTLVIKGARSILTITDPEKLKPIITSLNTNFMKHVNQRLRDVSSKKSPIADAIRYVFGRYKKGT
jgi:serine/threonine protein kinase